MRLNNVLRIRDTIDRRLMNAVVLLKLLLAPRPKIANALEARALSYEDWAYRRKPLVLGNRRIKTKLLRCFASNLVG